MFDSLSLAIKKLLEGTFPDIEVKFDRPADNFANQLSTLIVNAYLYDVREDTALRSNDLSYVRSNGQVTVERAPFYVTCSYVMTVWAHEDEDAPLEEQKLLGDLMRFIAGQTEIKVSDDGSPVPLQVGAIDELGSLSEFWTSLGNKLRPSFVLKATVALEPSSATERHPQASSLLVAVGPKDRQDPEHDPRYVIGGKVSYRDDIESGTVIRSDRGSFARITIQELSWQTDTDENGFYSFLEVPGTGASPYTLTAERFVLDETTQELLVDPGSKATKLVYVPRSKDKGHSLDYDFTL